MKRTKLRKLIATATIGATLVSVAQPTTAKALVTNESQSVEKAGTATRVIEGFPNGELSYDLYDDGTAVVTGLSGQGNPTDLVIPTIMTAPTDQGSYYVVGVKDNAFFSNSILKSVTLPNTIKSLGNTSFAGCSSLSSITLQVGLESIGNNCFQGCTSLQSVVIPHNVRSIGDAAFANCSGLKDVRLPDSIVSVQNSTFSGCVSLTSINIPLNVTSIGLGAFSNCKNLSTVDLPSKLTIIDTYGFYMCPALKSIALPNSLKSIGGNAFMSSGLTSITVPEGVTVIGDGAFSANSALLEASLPSTLKVTPAFGFEGDYSLSKVTLAEGIETIGAKSFRGCRAITSLNLPMSTVGIEDSAFLECSGLESITIPDSVKLLSVGVFSDCTKLSKVVLPSTLSTIGVEAFKNCKALTTVVLPSTVTDMRTGCFTNSGLTEITLPSGIKSVPSSAFSGCVNLEKANLANAAKVEASAFTGCSVLNDLDLSNVTSIEDLAFSNCSSLNRLSLNPDGVAIGKDSFLGCSNLPFSIEGQNICKIENNGEATIIGQIKTSTATVTTITIPNHVGTSTVTGIASVTLNDDLTQQSVTDINLADSVKTIGDNAFARAADATPVDLPKSINSIGKNAFNPNTDLIFNSNKYRLKDDVLTLVGFTGTALATSIGVNNISNMVIGEGVLSNNKTITEMTIPSNFSKIEKNAFSYCSNLATVTVPSSVKSISNGSFVGTKVSSVTLPEETIIAADSFNSDTEITCKKFKYKIVKGSIVITGYLGVDDEAIKIPSTLNGLQVTSIGANVFKDNLKVTDLIISEGITTIEESAFSGCVNLVRLTIPESLVSVGSSAFIDSNKIVSVNFLHTKDLISLQENSFNKLTVLSFKPKTFTVNFKNFDGAVISAQVINETKGATEPEIKPSREGYTFKGWDKSFTNINADTVVTAVFEKNPEIYTVTFKDSDGKDLSSVKVESGKGVAAPVNPTKAGSTFKSWDKGFDAITSDTVITATYTINTYKVVFKNSDGSVILESTVEYGKDAKSPEAPVKDGFTFTGWSKPITSISADTEVVATYSAKAAPTADTANLFGLLALASTSLGGLISGLKKRR